MVLGAVLLLAALSLFGWNQLEAKKAGDASGKALTEILAQIENQLPDGIPDPYDTAMTEKIIDGYGYVGYLDIPALNLQLPVMSEWDYERLRIAPCRYSGSVKSDDMVIAGHNYRQHFGSLQRLSVGDAVIFTDMDGVIHSYEVAAVDVLSPTAIEEMTAGEYDLSLFTCTYGGKSRVTVRCDRVSTEKKSYMD